MPAAVRISSTDAARTPRSANTSAAPRKTMARALASPSCTPDAPAAGLRGRVRIDDRLGTDTLCPLAGGASSATTRRPTPQRGVTRGKRAVYRSRVRIGRIPGRPIIAMSVGSLAVILLVTGTAVKRQAPGPSGPGEVAPSPQFPAHEPAAAEPGANVASASHEPATVRPDPPPRLPALPNAGARADRVPARADWPEAARHPLP